MASVVNSDTICTICLERIVYNESKSVISSNLSLDNYYLSPIEQKAIHEQLDSNTNNTVYNPLNDLPSPPHHIPRDFELRQNYSSNLNNRVLNQNNSPPPSPIYQNFFTSRLPHPPLNPPPPPSTPSSLSTSSGEEKLTNDNIVKLTCGHIFHRQCIDQWFGNSRTCPVCRSVEITYIVSNRQSNTNIIRTRNSRSVRNVLIFVIALFLMILIFSFILLMTF